MATITNLTARLERLGATSWPSLLGPGDAFRKPLLPELYEAVLTNIGNGLLALRGFERHAREEDRLYTFTVLMTFPNEGSGMVHDRMPVIVQPKDYQRWLNPENDDVADMLAPALATVWIAYPVNRRVNSPKNAGTCGAPATGSWSHCVVGGGGRGRR